MNCCIASVRGRISLPKSFKIQWFNDISIVSMKASKQMNAAPCESLQEKCITISLYLEIVTRFIHLSEYKSNQFQVYFKVCKTKLSYSTMELVFHISQAEQIPQINFFVLHEKAQNFNWCVVRFYLRTLMQFLFFFCCSKGFNFG